MNLKKVEEVLKEEGVFVSTTSGYSMYPLLRDRRDTIIVSPCEGRLKKYDVPLYKSGGRYILHRIVKVLPDAYVVCGDNCTCKEYGITDEQILGVLSGLYRDGKRVNINGKVYFTYSRLWVALYPLRCMCVRIKGKAARILRR